MRPGKVAIRLTGCGGGTDFDSGDERLAVLCRRVVSLRGKGFGFLDAKIKEEARSGPGARLDLNFTRTAPIKPCEDGAAVR